ncbi:transmembrane 220 family protein [Eudoraea chungangensis]|uniref:transmembrane 220 family protein n=1 Tax=Eudoraea chungangensis TaxID=1481905 RepID=UPI0023EE1237|nr:transmembrane 220 family protein [Eudoraea chungangensis]
MKALKYLSLIFGAMFLWAAYVQYNDPDVFYWYAIYGAAALASFLFYLNRLPYLVAIILGIIYVIITISTWPDQFEGVTIGQGDIVNVERGREALGMLILAITMFVYAIAIRKFKP